MLLSYILDDNRFSQVGKHTTSSSLDVAEVILKAVKSNNPEIRYLVGNDAVSLIEKRKNMTDKEFENWIKESLFEQKGFVR